VYCRLALFRQPPLLPHDLYVHEAIREAIGLRRLHPLDTRWKATLPGRAGAAGQHTGRIRLAKR
jgi:hypothetical protein